MIQSERLLSPVGEGGRSRFLALQNGSGEAQQAQDKPGQGMSGICRFEAYPGRPERLLADSLSICLMLHNMLDMCTMHARYLTLRERIGYT